jgi:hypothetical protein
MATVTGVASSETVAAVAIVAVTARVATKPVLAVVTVLAAMVTVAAWAALAAVIDVAAMAVVATAVVAVVNAWTFPLESGLSKRVSLFGYSRNLRPLSVYQIYFRLRQPSTSLTNPATAS